ncbi:unnamed protein product [Symbiodinium microadriaticum]|nr:unnamed protein product [Symbiodinium microadriaticum]
MSSIEQLSSGQVPFTADRLTALHQEIVELSEGLRQVHVEGLKQKAKDCFCKHGEKILAGSVNDSEMKSRDVEALLQCLSFFQNESSVVDTMKEVQEWANEHAQSMALTDLKDLAALSASSGLADLTKVQEIMPRLRKLQNDEKTEDVYEAVLSLVVHSLLSLMKEVKQGRLPQTTMIKRLGLIDGLAALVLDPQDLRAKAVKTHATLLKSGASLARTIHDFEKTGKDVEMRFSRDKNNVGLLGVLKVSAVFQQNVVQLKTAFEALTESIQNEMEAPEASAQQDESAATEDATMEPTEAADAMAALVAVVTDADDAEAGAKEKDQDAAGSAAAHKEPRSVQLLTLELLGIDSPGCFAGHLTSDVIVDGMLRVLSMRDESLRKRVKEFDAVLSKVTGENDWKRGFDGSSPIETVLDTSKKTIVSMPQRGAALGKLLDSISQETGYET